MKRVAVIIPCFNAERFIEEAVHSAIIQSNVDVEVIVVDDNSTDRSRDIVEGLCSVFPNVRLESNRFSKGVSGARNTGIELSNRCDFFAFLDADDCWEVNKLDTQIKAMSETGAMFCYSAYQIINENSKILGRFIPNSHFRRESLLYSCDVGCSTVVVDSNVMARYRFPHLPKEDFALWLIMLYRDHVSCVVLQEPLMRYRITSSSVSSNKCKEIFKQAKVISIVTGHSPLRIIKYIFIYGVRGLYKHYVSYRKCPEK